MSHDRTPKETSAETRAHLEQNIRASLLAPAEPTAFRRWWNAYSALVASVAALGAGAAGAFYWIVAAPNALREVGEVVAAAPPANSYTATTILIWAIVLVWGVAKISRAAVGGRLPVLFRVILEQVVLVALTFTVLPAFAAGLAGGIRSRLDVAIALSLYLGLLLLVSFMIRTVTSVDLSRKPVQRCAAIASRTDGETAR